MVRVTCRLASLTIRCSATIEAHNIATRNAITLRPWLVMAATDIGSSPCWRKQSGSHTAAVITIRSRAVRAGRNRALTGDELAYLGQRDRFLSYNSLWIFKCIAASDLWRKGAFY